MNVTELQAESARLESLLSETQTALADLQARFGLIRAELARRLRPSPEPRISDHALMRYIERVYGLDIEAIRTEVMSDSIVAALKTGASAVTVKGVKMLVKDGVIVTVVTDEMRNAGKAKRLRPYGDEDEAA
jgi:hypothetical protein